MADGTAKGFSGQHAIKPSGKSGVRRDSSDCGTGGFRRRLFVCDQVRSNPCRVDRQSVASVQSPHVGVTLDSR